MAKTMGITLELVEPRRVVLALPFHPDLTQQHGFLHAGALSTALDTACGFSAYTLMTAEASILTIENKINLFRPAKKGPFTIEALVVKPGRTVVVSDGQAHDVDGKLIATMTATNMAILDRDDVREP